METSLTLLESIKQSDDSQAWQLLNRIYAPLIKNWLHHAGVRVDDEDDLVQEIFIRLHEKIGSFERGPRTGSFRNWLKKITINCMRNYVRKKGNRAIAPGGMEFNDFLLQCEDDASETSQFWNEEYRQCVLKYLLQCVEPKFSPSTWQAFFETTLQSRSTRDVASDLNMSLGAVHTAKSRVLAEMRRLGSGLINDDLELPSGD